jgi:putative tricarboxylic transport membrane protein
MTGLPIAGLDSAVIAQGGPPGTFEAIGQGISIALSWPTVGLMVAGILIGIFIGSIPGIGPSIGMAVLLPLTLAVDAASGVILLISIYSGGMYGGSISAIMLNVPGTAGSAATTFDGYPLSRGGRAMDALVISAVSSGLGGLITVLALFAITPFLVEIVLLFTSPEYFLISILGLSMITVVAQGSMVKGLVAGFFGLMLTTIGIAETSADLRYTFESLLLFDGLHFIAILIGLFAISEMIKLSGETGGIARTEAQFEGSIIPGIKTVLSHPVGLVKSAFIGLIVGSIPGAGSSVANFVAYTEMVRSTKGGTFGDGDERGVIAPEAANNGNVAGSLIPTLSFGIPGSGATAVLLGGLILHGLIPGPNLFNDALDITYSIFFALLVGNLVILLVGLTVVRRFSYITKIDTNILVPMITVLAVVGSFALRRNMIDIATVFVIGIIGFYMKKHNYSIIAFVLGAVLGPIAEENLLRSLNLSNGSWAIFIERPLSILLVVMIFFVLFGPFLKAHFDRIRGADAS